MGWHKLFVLQSTHVCFCYRCGHTVIFIICIYCLAFYLYSERTDLDSKGMSIHSALHVWNVACINTTESCKDFLHSEHVATLVKFLNVSAIIIICIYRFFRYFFHVWELFCLPMLMDSNRLVLLVCFCHLYQLLALQCTKWAMHFTAIIQSCY